MSVLENICGLPPEGFIKVDISSNPNFVFTNDPNYQAKQLFDQENNTVFVNSYNECQHYVSGGWDFTPLKNNEIQLQDNLLYLLIVLIIVTPLLRKKIQSLFTK
tara:strand:- start:5109 stop:5420 length:312 start_codon:yes stop_codon:yes gene_type:complete